MECWVAILEVGCSNKGFIMGVSEVTLDDRNSLLRNSGAANIELVYLVFAFITNPGPGV
jgi:hypothetical protein